MHTSIQYPVRRTRDAAVVLGQAVRQWGGWMLDRIARLSALGMIEASAQLECAVEPAQAADREARLLRQAVYTNSPAELDWLWYASMMTNAGKRRFCLERALAINPASELVRDALAKLATTH